MEADQVWTNLLSGLVGSVIGAVASIIILILANGFTRKLSNEAQIEQDRHFRDQIDEQRRGQELAAVAALLSEIQNQLNQLPLGADSRRAISSKCTVLWLTVQPDVSSAWRSVSSASTSSVVVEHPLDLALRARASEFALAAGLPATSVLRRHSASTRPDGTRPPLVALGLGDSEGLRDALLDLSGRLLSWSTMSTMDKRQIFDHFLDAACRDLSKAIWFANKLIGGSEETPLLHRLDLGEEAERQTHIANAVALLRGIKLRTDGEWSREFDDTYRIETTPELPTPMRSGGEVVVTMVPRVRGPWEIVYTRAAFLEDGNRIMATTSTEHARAIDAWFSNDSPHR